MEKLLPIGIDDFKEIVNTCYYVDKTMLVNEIIQAPNNSVFLFTRPQRFGKSLSLSMLRYYFSMQEDSAALFKNLLIDKVERAKSYLNSVPVVRFNFKGTVEETFEGVMNRFRSCIADGFRQVSGLIDLTKLNEYDADYYRLASKGDASIDYADAIKNLSRMLFLSTEKKTIFLIDEYDAPVESALERIL